MATRQTTEYLSSTNGYRVGRRSVSTGGQSLKQTQKQSGVHTVLVVFFSSTRRSVTTSGGMHLLQSSLKMMLC